MPDTTTPAVTGLSTSEVIARRDRYGTNTLPEPRPRGLLSRVGTQLRDPLILVLLGAMAVTIALRDAADLLVIGLVIVLNTTVGVVQEVRADQAVAALRRLAAPRTRVVRDGQEQPLPAADLVPDDVVRLDAGDVVPADVLLHEAVRVTVDEAAMTGESVPVPRAAGDELSAGTVLATGRATGVVVRTGSASALGRIAAMVAAEPYRQTPLQRRLAGLGAMLAIVAVVLSTLVGIGSLLRGVPWGEALLSAVSLVVAAVPESLPAVVTVSLALGAARMARRAAIIRRLPAVETLGSVTVVATDKTGTLTEGLMSTELLVLPDEDTVTLGGTGYEPTGQVWPPPDDAARALVRAALLCSDADIVPPDAEHPAWRAVGDPMEAALVVAAARCGIPPATRADYPRRAEVPFDATRRRMVTLHRDPAGGYVAAAKGAPEVMLPAGALRRRAEQLAADGYRVLAVAAGHFADVPSDLDVGLTPLGLVALADPVRRGAAAVAARFADAGIRLVMVTGDHPATASAIARAVGLPTDRVLLGGEPVEDINGTSVFARTRPEHKLDLIGALQAAGEVVAMTGDGVNDAPALRRADIGVAMGAGGTEAARQAADLVLADDNLATVGVAVEEGRRIYANIRRFLAYALSGGLAEVAVMLAGPWFGLRVPLLPAQILWINMLTHGLPGVAMGTEPGEPAAMRRPPRRPDEAILGAGLGVRVLGTGGVIAATALATAIVADRTGTPWQSALFLVLGLAQLWVAIALRVRRGRLGWLDAAVAMSVVLQVAGVWVAPLRELLGTEPLTLAEVALCAAVAAIPGIAVFLVYRRRGTL